MATRTVEWARTSVSRLTLRYEDQFDPWRVSGAIVENGSTEPVAWSAIKTDPVSGDDVEPGATAPPNRLDYVFAGGIDNGDGTVTPQVTTLNIPAGAGVRMHPPDGTLIGWRTEFRGPSAARPGKGRP